MTGRDGGDAGREAVRSRGGGERGDATTADVAMAGGVIARAEETMARAARVKRVSESGESVSAWGVCGGSGGLRCVGAAGVETGREGHCLLDSPRQTHPLSCPLAACTPFARL